MNDDAKKTRTVSARVPEELADQIQKLARKNTRSISHQMEHMLKLALAVEAVTEHKDPVALVREVFARNGAHKKTKES